MGTTAARTVDPITALRVTADTHGLDTNHLITTPNGREAHVFTADVNDLGTWLDELGGHVTRQPAGDGLDMWSFHTHTDFRSDGTSTPIVMHALTLTGQLVPSGLIAALAA